MLHTANTVEATCKHVGFPLCIQPYCQLQVLLGRTHVEGCFLCTSPRPFTMFMHVIRCVDWMYYQCAPARTHSFIPFHSKHLFYVFAPPTAAILTSCNFICTGWSVLQKSWWQQPQQQVQHFWQESTTHYLQQPQQQQWWQLNAQPAKRRYLAKTVCLHFSALSPLWLGFTRTLCSIQMMTLSTPNEHPNALLSKCCHCFHQIKIIFCNMKTGEVSSTLQYGTFFFCCCCI